MNLILFVILIILIGIYSFKRYKKINYDLSRLPPLIPGKFYLGNYFDLKEQPVHLSLTKLGEKYHHAFCINIFGQLMVVLNSREAIAQILSSKTLEYADR
ncbi:unnamed protein product, partial [Brachionus calyciflorus]